MKQTRSLSTAIFALGLTFSAACAIGCSDAGGEETEDDASDQLPDDFTQTSIEAFLDAQTYKAWAGDTEIRVGGDSVNPHGDALRVYFNDAALTSINEALTPAADGAMAVKEIYSSEGNLLGHAVSIKSGDGEGMATWTYYCNLFADEGLCGDSGASLPIYGEGAGSCGFCHGETFYADVP
jgi:hypothetical protein